MAQQAQASIVGIKALMRDVDKQCKDERSLLFAAMKKAGYAAVAPIVPAVRGALPHSDAPGGHWHRPGALSTSVRASAYRSGAAVRMGSKAVSYAGWVDFGGRRSRPHLTERPYVQNGRYLFPAARAHAARAAEEYVKAINDTFGKTAVWTNATATPEAVHD
jgi:hypothetical protein